MNPDEIQSWASGLSNQYNTAPQQATSPVMVGGLSPAKKKKFDQLAMLAASGTLPNETINQMILEAFLEPEGSNEQDLQNFDMGVSLYESEDPTLKDIGMQLIQKSSPSLGVSVNNKTPDSYESTIRSGLRDQYNIDPATVNQLSPDQLLEKKALYDYYNNPTSDIYAKDVRFDPGTGSARPMKSASIWELAFGNLGKSEEDLKRRYGQAGFNKLNSDTQKDVSNGAYLNPFNLAKSYYY